MPALHRRLAGRRRCSRPIMLGCASVDGPPYSSLLGPYPAPLVHPTPLKAIVFARLRAWAKLRASEGRSVTPAGEWPGLQKVRSSSLETSCRSMKTHPPPAILLEYCGLPLEWAIGPLSDVERTFAPEQLWVEGDASLLRHPLRVSIVGSRNPTAEGLRQAGEIAAHVVSAGGVVVSGLARGIDTAVHLVAMDAGGRTIAVIGTPLERAYPPENAGLQARIARDHLAVSQFEPGERTTRSSFPRRNATMALLSHVTVIVEAGARSGTRHQAEECIRLGRLLLLLDTVGEECLVSWGKAMIEQGARVLPSAQMATALGQHLIALTRAPTSSVTRG